MQAELEKTRPREHMTSTTDQRGVAPRSRTQSAFEEGTTGTVELKAEVRELNFFYGKLHALKDISMALAANQVLAIVRLR